MSSACRQCGCETRNKSFCSHPCYWLFRKQNKMLPPTRKGSKMTEEQRQKIKEWHKKNPNHKKFQKGQIAWNKGMEMLNIRGENHPRWVGGSVKHPDKRIRQSAEYIFWRTSVFKRDDYTCQICFVRGGILQADHIIPFAISKEKRFDLENGRTLCVDCHKKTPTYGGKVISLKKKYV